MTKLKNYELVQRGDNLTIAPTQGIYNQPLFDPYSDDAISSLVLFGGYNSALDAIGFRTSNIYRRHLNYLTYIAAAGAAADSATNSSVSDPCAPGNSTEWGRANYIIEGWGRMRRSTPLS